MDRNRLIVIAAIIILVGAGAYFLIKDNNKQTDSSTTSTQPTTQTPTQSNENQSSNTESSNNQQSASTITYNGSSFSPATLTVKSGTVVTVKNTSSDDLQFDSDPHPVHTDDTDLNVGVISAGGSMTFTATKKGTFGYHNHLDPTQKGTITVQ